MSRVMKFTARGRYAPATVGGRTTLMRDLQALLPASATLARAGATRGGETERFEAAFRVPETLLAATELATGALRAERGLELELEPNSGMPETDGRPPYVIAEAGSLGALQEKVNELVLQGYAPTGGLTTNPRGWGEDLERSRSGSKFAQAMFLASKMNDMIAGGEPL